MRLILLFAALSLLGAIDAQAGEPEDQAVRTQYSARIDGRKVAYAAEAGRLPVRDMETAELRGRIFYVSYRVAPGDGAPRPVLFSWGGGPSGPALGMQMVYAPKVVSDSGDLVDNDLSLLSVADLVFVDPIGTGFSRAAKPEYVDEFYGTTGDARSIAEFVRIWIAVNDAESAPVFLNGQSYGVWRAAFAAELLEQSGRRVAGIVITSGGMGMADEYAERAFELALRVPDYAATAFNQGRLGPEFGDSAEDAWRRAESWALETYGPALARIDALSDDEREAVARELSAYTGYPLERIDRATLSFTPPEYRSGFLGDEETRLDIFDMRRVSTAVGSGGDDARRNRALARFLREHLGYRSDLAYLGLETGYTPVTAPDYRPIGWRWNYDSGDTAAGPPPDGGPPGKEPWVRRAIDINPALQVFVEAAVYDSLNFCAANEDRKRRMPAELADNFELHCYFAGHGSFRDPVAYPLIIDDMRRFISRVAAGSSR